MGNKAQSTSELLTGCGRSSRGSPAGSRPGGGPGRGFPPVSLSPAGPPWEPGVGGARPTLEGGGSGGSKPSPCFSRSSCPGTHERNLRARFCGFLLCGPRACGPEAGWRHRSHYGGRTGRAGTLNQQSRSEIRCGPRAWLPDGPGGARRPPTAQAPSACPDGGSLRNSVSKVGKLQQLSPAGLPAAPTRSTPSLGHPAGGRTTSSRVPAFLLVGRRNTGLLRQAARRSERAPRG